MKPNKTILSLFCLISFYQYLSQPIPSNRVTDWTGAGENISIYDTVINIIDFGGDSTGSTDNALALSHAMGVLPYGGTIYFPTGDYLFSSTQNIRKGIRIKGGGADNTVFNFDNRGFGDCFLVSGILVGNMDTVSSGYQKDSKLLNVKNASIYLPGDYIKIIEDDNGRIFSSWANNSIGQIVMIDSVDFASNTIYINQPLRQTYATNLYPRIVKIIPKQNVAFECFTINRIDPTGSQTNNINFSRAANCLVHGVKSLYTNFAHVNIQESTNITVSESFFKNGHDYGGGGKAYGVVMQATAGYNLIENNQFEHLRHSILLQSSANGNVIAYNYSIDPFWTSVALPANSAGDIVLHGNYAYMNLFEGNIAQNIVIDNSHGINGPYNTFFRNRAESYGFFMNNSPASNSQNFVANEIPNTSIGFYALSGTNHFEYGNAHHGIIVPAGTDTLNYESYYLSETPLFWDGYYNWAGIGVSNPYLSGNIPAKKNYEDSIKSTCFEDTIYHDILLCPSNSFEFNGKVYSHAGFYIDSNENYRGSKVYFKLSISELSRPQIKISANELNADSGLAYQWYFGNTLLAGETNQLLNYTQNGYYKVLVTDLFGCAQFSDSVLVNNASISNLSNHKVKVYPNPATDLIHIVQENKLINRIEIIDFQGKTVGEYSNIERDHIIRISNLISGVYLMKLYTGNSILLEKVIVQ